MSKIAYAQKFVDGAAAAEGHIAGLTGFAEAGRWYDSGTPVEVAIEWAVIAGYTPEDALPLIADGKTPAQMVAADAENRLAE